MIEAQNILELKNIRKQFPGVIALDNVDFDLRRGEVHALVGHNGAGKSTLLKIIAGSYKPDSGEMVFDGNTIHNWSTKAALNHGINLIYQELNLVQDMTVTENLFLGRELLGQTRLLEKKKMRNEARKALQEIGAEAIDVRLPLHQISVAQQQMVAIAKALDQSPKLLVLDEPTSRLSLTEINNLFDIIRGLTQKGISVIYVSHRIEEIFRIADRVTVLRDGRKIATHLISEIIKEQLIREMIGEELREMPIHDPSEERGEILLEVENLSGPRTFSVSFELRQSEVLGILGAVGSGKTELVQLLSGLGFDTQKIQGRVLHNGKDVTKQDASYKLRNGIALCPEDRKKHGLILDDTLTRNISLAAINKFTLGGLIVNQHKEIQHAKKMISDLRIATPSVNQHTKNLSGGNQQKVVIGKWISTDSDIFIFDEPTIGVDVKGKSEIYYLIKELANTGAGVIVFSSDVEEALLLSTRILVMFEGEIVCECKPHDETIESLTKKVMGG